MGRGQAGRNASPAAHKPTLPPPRQSADRLRDGGGRVAVSSPRRKPRRRRGGQGQEDTRTPRGDTPARGDQRRDGARRVNQSRSNSPAVLVAHPPSVELPLLVVVHETAAVAGVEGGGDGAERGSVPPTLRSRSERSIVTELPIDRTLPASHRVAVSPSDGRVQRSSPGRSPSGSRGSSLRSASSRRGRQSATRSPAREDRPPVVLRPRDSPTRRGASPAGGADRTSPRPPPRGRVPPPPPRRVETRSSRGKGQGSVQGRQSQRRSPGGGGGGGGNGGGGVAPPSRSNL